MAGDFEDNGVYWMGGCVEICHGILGTTFEICHGILGTTLRVIDRVT